MGWIEEKTWRGYLRSSSEEKRNVVEIEWVESSWAAEENRKEKRDYWVKYQEKKSWALKVYSIWEGNAEEVLSSEGKRKIVS